MGRASAWRSRRRRLLDSPDGDADKQRVMDIESNVH